MTSPCGSSSTVLREARSQHRERCGGLAKRHPVSAEPWTWQMSPSNIPFDRTAGSHSLAAAGQRGR
jgi:hypothetical protein